MLLLERLKKNRKGKRSLYVSADVKIGERFTDKNIKSVRPGFGLDTRFFEMVVGRKAARNLTKGDRLDWEDRWILRSGKKSP